MRGPKLKRGFEVQPHLYWVQGDDPCLVCLATGFLIQTRILFMHENVFNMSKFLPALQYERLNSFRELQSRKEKSPISGITNHYYTWNWPLPKWQLFLTVTESLACSHPSSTCFIFCSIELTLLMILGNLFEITFSISSICIAKTLSKNLWGFWLLSASDALVPRAFSQAAQNIELPCKWWCEVSLQRQNNNSKGWWAEGTWRHKRNLKTIKKPATLSGEEILSMLRW